MQSWHQNPIGEQLSDGSVFGLVSFFVQKLNNMLKAHVYR